VQTDGTGAKMNIHALAPNKKGPSRLSLADESVRQIDSSACTRAQKANRAHTHTHVEEAQGRKKFAERQTDASYVEIYGTKI
jgi:uncharacterized protein GlcG (DUF336 family)